jgi:O-antigen/teichoic acid export membrane protein
VRTIEPAFWILGLVVGLGTTASASLIVHHWLRISHLSPATAEHAVILMGWAMAFRAPLNLYLGGLQGLERQVSVNILNGAIGTFQGCGSVLLLWLISPTVVVFFAWQVMLGFLQLVSAAFLLRRALPAPALRTQSRMAVLRGVWRFALGTNADTFVSFAAGQMDKIVLSKVLPLQMYGYYALASTVASCLFRIAGPIQAAVYPRYTHLVAAKDENSLRSLYHDSSQLISALVVPAAVVLGVFAQEVIFVWTHSRDTASQVAPILRFLAFGSGFAALFSAPNALLLANGWVSLLLYSHIGALLFAAAAVASLTWLFGAVGAALAWLLLNAAFVLIVVTIMHRRLLRGDVLHWMRQSVATPLLASLAVVGPARLLTPPNLGAPTALAIVVVVSILSLASSGFATLATRRRALDFLSRARVA